jgi:hypothetical protein
MSAGLGAPATPAATLGAGPRTCPPPPAPAAYGPRTSWSPGWPGPATVSGSRPPPARRHPGPSHTRARVDSAAHAVWTLPFASSWEAGASMTATVVSDPSSATVVLDGEIDIATAPAIRRLLMAAISDGNAHLASWSPRLTGPGKREAACRCWRRPGRCGGCWTSCPWRRSCRPPSAQRAPSLPAAPPDVSLAASRRNGPGSKRRDGRGGMAHGAGGRHSGGRPATAENGGDGTSRSGLPAV